MERRGARGWGVGDILGEEVSGLRVASAVSDNEEKARERLVRRLEGVFGNEEGRDGMREWKRVVRERVCDLSFYILHTPYLFIFWCD